MTRSRMATVDEAYDQLLWDVSEENWCVQNSHTNQWFEIDDPIALRRTAKDLITESRSVEDLFVSC